MQEGCFWITEHDSTIYGPVRCRGEADNAAAREAGNPDEDPRRAYGDHPGGLYAITSVERKDAGRYGPWFLRLDPLGGEALMAKQNGRAGIGIHGGNPHADGRLRETFGCLRLTDEATQRVGDLVVAQLAGAPVLYECLILV